MSVYLCDAADTGQMDVCCCCGGIATLGGTQEALIGSSPNLRYCSVECLQEWESELMRMASRCHACYDSGGCDECERGLTLGETT